MSSTTDTSRVQVAAPEQRIDAGRVMELKQAVFVWSCPGCVHVYRFKADQVDAIPFFIVRHLMREHGIAAGRIVAVEPALAAEVQAYCRVMRPVG